MRLFTSESVTEGHPDKMADQISDAVLDAIYKEDSYARVACETLVTTGLVLVSGEITTDCYVDIPKVVRETIREIGYSQGRDGFDCDTCAVLTALDEQSGDIAQGVNKALEIRDSGETHDELAATGAGDQGMMYGYATNETPEMMPLPISLAHKLVKKLADVRKSGLIPYLRPDGKSQVTVAYDGNRPVRIDCVVIGAQHDPSASLEQIRADMLEQVIKPTVPAEYLDKATKYLVNATGRFVIGGPQGDTGVTGRKIILDTYGGMARHGGGAFSGKDPTKVDRSASYAARYAAKNIVAAGLAEQCEIQIAYVIGVAKPVSVTAYSFGTGVMDDQDLGRLIEKHFDLRPAAIIRDLELRRPIYRQLASYGHFGRLDLDLPWERLDKAEILKASVK